MKMFFPIFLLVFFVSVFRAEPRYLPPSRLINALIQVESGGDDNTIGDKKLKFPAYGCLQIRQPCVRDVNDKFKKSFKAKDCLGNRELSILICQAYISIWAKESRLGRVPTPEDMARIWNGGPNGWKRNSTRDYWEKVKRELEKD